MAMQQKWARNDTWVDWTGKEHSGWEQFKYVTGVAVTDLGQSEQGGTRDRGHEGWTTDRFLAEVNADLRANAKQAAKGEGAAAELTRNEMLAIRLYTGPAYQPLNLFLREVSKLGADWRRRLARSHQFSYAATVRHLSDGLRKLARMSTEVSLGSGSGGVSCSRVCRLRCACC